MRTQPLWGVRTQARMLHDGRARNFDEAIIAHEGQGRQAKLNFLNLNIVQKAQLRAFLNSL